MENSLRSLASAYGVRADYFDEAGSTNDVARVKCYGHGDLVVARSQSRGRGQRGNHWESAPGANLTFSIVLEPVFLPAGEQFLLSEAVSLAVADLLESYGIVAAIKWPNDIYSGDTKVAGILIENDICGANLARSIVGVGLNVNQMRFSPALPNPSSMALLSGGDFAVGEVLERLYGKLMLRYGQLEEGRAEQLCGDYLGRLYRLGVPAVYRTPGDGEFTGIIRGVEESGELDVEHPDGSVRGYLFKEIEFIL